MLSYPASARRHLTGRELHSLILSVPTRLALLIHASQAHVHRPRWLPLLLSLTRCPAGCKCCLFLYRWMYAGIYLGSDRSVLYTNRVLC